jgi:hypothetical protein
MPEPSPKDDGPPREALPGRGPLNGRIELVGAAGFEPAWPEGRVGYSHLSSLSQTCSARPWWTHGDLHPDRRCAGAASCCWTMGPEDFAWCSPGELNSALHGFSVTCNRYTRTADLVASEGLEPSSRCSEHRILPLDDKASAPLVNDEIPGGLPPSQSMAVPTGVAPATSAVTRRRLHGFGLGTTIHRIRGWRAAEESHPAARIWKPPWSLDRGPDTSGFPGAPCGSRTRITGLEDRRSALELRTRELIARERGGRRDGFPPSALPPRASFPARLSENCSTRPRANPMAACRDNKKTPRLFERGV